MSDTFSIINQQDVPDKAEPAQVELPVDTQPAARFDGRFKRAGSDRRPEPDTELEEHRLALVAGSNVSERHHPQPRQKQQQYAKER